jgi:hypothetical protein
MSHSDIQDIHPDLPRKHLSPCSGAGLNPPVSALAHLDTNKEDGTPHSPTLWWSQIRVTYHVRIAVPEIKVSLINRKVYPQLADDSIADSETSRRDGSLVRYRQGQEEPQDMEEQLHANYETQVDFMEMLGGDQCIFCLLAHTPDGNHATESCQKAQLWPKETIPSHQFASSVKQWSRVMPFFRGGATKYCGFCRFPLAGNFHEQNPPSCKYNDFMNRTAWALWHNERFHDIVLRYSQNRSNSSIDIPSMRPTDFKEWLLQEATPGMTHLFQIFCLLVRGEVSIPYFFLFVRVLMIFMTEEHHNVN